jgi:uncharacterized membrane protein
MYNSYRNYENAPTTLGIPERWERVLAYALGWISGLILLIIEQRNQTVRRHAAQSVVVFGGLSLLGLALTILGGVFGAIPLIGPLFGGLFGLLGGIVGAVTFAMWVLLMILAFFSEKTLITGPRFQRFF